MRADFQQFYNLNIEHMGRDFSTLHAAELLVELPQESRIHALYLEDGAWTLDRTLAAMAVNALNILVWQRSKDGQKNRKRPKLIGPFGSERDGDGKLEASAMSVEELDYFLSLPRREV